MSRLLVLRPSRDTVVVLSSDTGRWVFAAGTDFGIGTLHPHDAAIFWRSDLLAQYVWSEAAQAWQVLSGGSGAPTGAEYITSAAHAELSAERVLTDTATVTWDFGTPGQAKATASAAAAPDNDARFLALAAM